MTRVTELHPEQAVTIFSPVRITRDHPTHALTPVDLENYISQAVWKFFDQCRGEAAEKLGVREMELKLSDIRITGVRMDGHQVINPIGFAGREFEVGLSLTVTKQGVETTNGYLVEGGSTRAYILSKLLGLERAFFIESGNVDTNIFSINNGDIRHLSGFSWGGRDVAGALQNDALGLGLDGDLLQKIYHKYAWGDVSEKFRRRVDRVFYKAFMPFINGVLLNVKNVGGMRLGSSPLMYFCPQFPVPASVYRRCFPFGAMRVKFFRSDEPLDVEGFINENACGIYEELNELAVRRIKWLMPNS